MDNKLEFEKQQTKSIQKALNDLLNNPDLLKVKILYKSYFYKIEELIIEKSYKAAIEDICLLESGIVPLIDTDRLMFELINKGIRDKQIKRDDFN